MKMIRAHVSQSEGFKEPFRVEKGYAILPDKPGLGIEVDEAALERHAFDGIWETPQFQRQDGSFAEW